jgi:eukaryotic-like serine/threonine-protein kinase
MEGLTPDGELTTLVDFRVGVNTGDSSVTNTPAVLRDENELRLERMMRREHLVYGVPTPFVGQRSALETLYNAVRDSVNQRTFRTIGVTGQPGMGKTRLVAELFGIIDPLTRGLRVITASCSDAESTDGTWLFGQFVRSRAGIRSSDKPTEAHAKIGAVVGECFRDKAADHVTRLLTMLAKVQYDEAAPVVLEEDPNRLEWRTLEACFDFLKEDSLAHPLIIVIHRAQFMSARTIECLVKFLESASDRRITMLFLHDRPTSAELVRASSAHDEVTLLPLDAAAMERLVRAILVNVHDLPDSLLEDVIARSAGNPGLVEDNIRLLIQRGVIIRHEHAWTVNPSRLGKGIVLPESRAAATLARVESLTPRMKEVLEFACIFGPTFWSGGATALARCQSTGAEGWTIPWVSDQTKGEVQAGLDEALNLELVLKHEKTTIEGEDEYSFASRDVRNILYDGLASERRALFHRMVAQWLGRLDFSEGRHWFEVVANHLELGGRPERAAEAYQQAGRVMLQVSDWGRASEFFQRALALVDLSRADVLIPVLEGLGDSAYASGDFASSQQYYGAMLEASLVPPSRRAGATAWMKLGRTHRSLGVYPKALACFQHALKLFRETEATSGVADTLHDIATLKWLMGQAGGYDEAISYYRESLALRRESAEPMAVADSLTAIANVLLQQGEVDIAHDRYQEALDIQRKHGSRATQISSYIGLGMVAYARKTLNEAIQRWQVGLAIAEEVGAKDRMGVLMNNIGELYLEQGDLDLSKGMLERALELTSETGDQRTGAEVSRNLAMLALENCEFAMADTYAQQAVKKCRLINARPTLGLALRTKAHILSHQLYADDSGPSAATIEAGNCFEEAIRIFEEIGDRLELARTLRGYASHVEERGAVDKASDLRNRADRLED